MIERVVPDAETDLSGLLEDRPIGAIDPPRVGRRKARFWPETTPILGMTPVLPDAESGIAPPLDAG